MRFLEATERATTAPKPGMRKRAFSLRKAISFDFEPVSGTSGISSSESVVSDGSSVGSAAGSSVGSVGVSAGSSVGSSVGSVGSVGSDGSSVGSSVGSSAGSSVGSVPL